MSPAEFGGRSAYEVLGVSFDADTAQLKAAWRRAARRTHPDYGGDSAEFRLVSYAWELVGDPAARREYDRGLGSARPRGTGPGHPGAGPASRPSGPGPRTTAARSTRRPTGRGGAAPTVRYVPSLDDEVVLDLVRSSQQIHGAPRKRGILPAGHRLVREARTIRTVQAHVLSALPATRMVNGLQLTFGRMNSGAVDHVLLCGDRLAVLGSLQVPDGVYRWDGDALLTGARRVLPPSLAPAMVALQRAFPDCTVGGYVLVLGPEDNPHAPVIQVERGRGAPDAAAGFLNEPPANALQFGRDLKMFLGTGAHPDTVDRRLLARLLGAMY